MGPLFHVAAAAVIGAALADVPVTVTVTLEGGGPLPRFQLQFVPSNPQPSNVPAIGRPILIVGARTQQQFPLGEYRLSPASTSSLALPPGYIVKSMTAGGVDLLTQPLKITAADAPEIAIVLGLSATSPWVRVVGRITGYEATPVPGLSLRIESSTLASALTASVNPDGSFEFPRVLPGTYQVRLTPAPDTFPRTIAVGSTNLANVEIPLRIPSLRIEGTADSPPLRPTQILRATIRPEPGGGPGLFGSATVAPNGFFAFTSVPPGNYLLSIGICESDVCNSSGGITVSVVDRDITGLVVSTQGSSPAFRAAPVATVPAAESIEGSVVMEGGGTQPAFRLRFTIGAVTRILPVSETSFTASLLPGEYQVSVADLPAGYEVRSITEGANDLRLRPLTVTASSNNLRPFLPLRRITITLGVVNAPRP